ncbi:hypothetical protein JOB18_026324 [Solea senegalensis]|uniref:Uncharacterized protein n=1 Tax=Solea senegalensis TaxID=28829 RepID=A0AAV6RC68_SOLSE|nr:hypothetical protein JOB18_026324 [Solea senegalensis]
MNASRILPPVLCWPKTRSLSSAQSGQSRRAVVQQLHCSVVGSYGGAGYREAAVGGNVIDLCDRSGQTPPCFPSNSHRLTLSSPALVRVIPQ